MDESFNRKKTYHQSRCLLYLAAAKLSFSAGVTPR
jgi:hypothetical protein